MIINTVKMSMETELLILAALMIIFIVSFCGLLQKIRKSESERTLAARTRVSSPRVSLTEIYVNPVFHNSEVNDTSQNSQGVFPSSPPPYAETFCDPPPKYEDIIKHGNFHVSTNVGNDNTIQA